MRHTGQMKQVFLLVLPVTYSFTTGTWKATEPLWRHVLRDPAFTQFLDQLSYKTAPVDISISRSCFNIYAGIHDDLYNLSKRLKSTSRLITTRNAYCQPRMPCFTTYGVVSKAAIFLCGPQWTDLAWTFAHRYSHLVAVFAGEFYEENEGFGRFAFRTRISSSLEHGAYYNVSFYNNHTMLTMGPKTECLSCKSSAVLAKESLRITRQVPLKGRELRVHCLHPYICERPTFPVLVDALFHKGANLTTFKIDSNSASNQHLAEAFVMHSVSAVVYNPTPEIRRAIRVPEIIIPAYYDSFSYYVFARRRHPLPKHAVLFLPFTYSVWAALTCAMALCIASLKLVERLPPQVHGRRGGSQIACILVGLLFQQGCLLPKVLRDRTAARLVISVWAFLAVVMSTVFRACLTSLLRDVPLEGQPLVFVNEDDVRIQGYHCCRLTYAGDGLIFSFSVFAPVKRKQHDCISAENKVMYMNNTKRVYLLHAPTIATHDVYVKQLYRNDYAPLSWKLSPYLSGPSVRSNSRYREAIKGTIVGAFESGLFQRALLLDEHKKSYKAEQEKQYKEPKIVSLTFGDLSGCINICAYGSAFATACLFLEFLLKGVHNLSLTLKKEHTESERLFYKRRGKQVKKHGWTFTVDKINLSEFRRANLPD